MQDLSAVGSEFLLTTKKARKQLYFLNENN